MRFLHEIEEELLGHYICIHGDVPVLCVAAVRLDGEHALLLVDIQRVACKECFLRIVNGMIHHGNVRAGLYVFGEELAVVCGVDHVARCDHNVRLRQTLDAVQVLHVGFHVCAVDIADLRGLGVHNVQLAALGVDVVVASGAEVLGQGTRFLADIDLDVVDAAVAHIRDREINDAVTSEE